MCPGAELQAVLVAPRDKPTGLALEFRLLCSLRHHQHALAIVGSEFKQIAEHFLGITGVVHDKFELVGVFCHQLSNDIEPLPPLVVRLLPTAVGGVGG